MGRRGDSEGDDPRIGGNVERGSRGRQRRRGSARSVSGKTTWAAGRHQRPRHGPEQGADAATTGGVWHYEGVSKGRSLCLQVAPSDPHKTATVLCLGQVAAASAGSPDPETARLREEVTREGGDGRATSRRRYDELAEPSARRSDAGMYAVV